MKAKIIITRRAECPECETGGFTIAHDNGRYGPWGCTVCGARFRVTVSDEEVTLEREPLSDVPGWLVVRCEGRNPPLYFIIDSPFYAHSAHKSPDEQRNDTESWVNEHTCPRNLVPVDAIVEASDPDPHGVLAFVGHVAKGHWSEAEPAGGWAALIADALKQAQSYDADA